jgi:hypothetical protein
MISPFQKKVVFVHTGHIGDIIAFLPVFYGMGGTKLVIRDEEPWMEPMFGYKYDSLKPLLESQGIEVSFGSTGGGIDFDMSGWRECYRNDISLMDAQARYVNFVPRNNGHVEIYRPWITVNADPLTKGRVIFNRSHRYRNENFPWKKVLKHFGDRALFTGTENEHKDFCKEVGQVEYYKTPSCLQVAEAIEGSDFFVGNQSSSFWIAAALMKPLIQETHETLKNSVVPYDKAVYCSNGDLDL